MYSEFHNIALDQIRYSLVWEDSTTLYDALDIKEGDHLLIIISAGCNVLNALLKKPESISAVDLNPVQNQLLILKLYLVKNFNYNIFSALLGLKGESEVKKGWNVIKDFLPQNLRNTWEPIMQAYPGGLLSAGKLERYINGFLKTLPEDVKAKLNRLFSFNEVQLQSRYFEKELHHSAFKSLFIDYFDEENLSKGRDPRLFKYAQESGGEAFYSRLRSFISRYLAKDNFYLRFFFFGISSFEKEHDPYSDALMPQEILPPCYQAENFETLKEQAHKVAVHNGEAVDFLLSSKGSEINKASLSNIFEYTSIDEFNKVCGQLYHQNPGLQIVFWNLLQFQGDDMPDSLNEILSVKTWPAQKNSCFYFNNIKKLEPVNILIP